MRRGLAATVLALLVASGVAVGAYLLAAGPGVPSPPRAAKPGIDARAHVDSADPRFGDRVIAHVEALVDRRLYDPSRLRLQTVFTPFQQLGPTERIRHDEGPLTRLTWRFDLRCLTISCLPQKARKELVFPPARLVYRGGSKQGSIPHGGLRVGWPIMDISTRLPANQERRADPLAPAAWRADTRSLPAVTYAISPRLLEVALVALAALLLAAAALLVRRFVRRKLPPPPPPPPAPIELTPLELALVALEAARESGDATEQRKALELLHEELLAAGEEELATAARDLAWSPGTPPSAATAELQEQVREAVAASANGRQELEAEVPV